jgi:hypothetical protein
MNEMLQSAVNFHYIQAQYRQIKRLEAENKALREVLEATRQHLVALGRTNV